eukprot:TRINITY_DN8617_c0_g1_i1.p2 TRINITY_DN8617_c0_g1~~TRINITY_DN8617_c0_g1_i1.p2  ORF type:complete len:170 (-),score=32.56 TRINITY_DN8617_c0_g1_i1:3-512(-)
MIKNNQIIFVNYQKKLQPSLVITEQKAANWVQDECKKEGATLVSNLKPNQIKKIAAVTEATPQQNIDNVSKINGQILGYACQNFYLKQFLTLNGQLDPTIMHFDNCLTNQINSFSLCSSKPDELSQLKKRLKHILKLAYNPVSYTHLTLPTKRIVQILEGAAPLKKIHE